LLQSCRAEFQGPSLCCKREEEEEKNAKIAIAVFECLGTPVGNDCYKIDARFRWRTSFDQQQHTAKHEGNPKVTS
jgi:hypothetical protein